MKKYSIIILCLLLANLTNAQNQNYNGPLQGGQATYEYYENDNYERIYNGKFSYAKKERDESVMVTGFFKENSKEGNWSYTTKDINFKYEYKGSYSNGYMNGDWVYYSEMYGFDKKTYKSSSTASFKDGKFIGKLIFTKDDKNKLEMNFNSDGLLEGNWECKYEESEQQIVDTRKYIKGVLTFRLLRNIETGEVIEKFDNTDFVQSFFSLYKDGAFVNIDGVQYVLSPANENDKLYSHWDHFFVWGEEYSDFTGKKRDLGFLLFDDLTGKIYQYRPKYNLTMEILKASESRVWKDEFINVSNQISEHINKAKEYKCESYYLYEVREIEPCREKINQCLFASQEMEKSKILLDQWVNKYSIQENNNDYPSKLYATISDYQNTISSCKLQVEERVNKINEKENQLKQLEKDGDDYLAKNEFSLALESYEQARKIKKEEAGTLTGKVNQTKNLAYQYYLDESDAYAKNMKFDLAIESLYKSLDFLPKGVTRSDLSFSRRDQSYGIHARTLKEIKKNHQAIIELPDYKNEKKPILDHYIDVYNFYMNKSFASVQEFESDMETLQKIQERMNTDIKSGSVSSEKLLKKLDKANSSEDKAKVISSI